MKKISLRIKLTDEQNECILEALKKGKRVKVGDLGTFQLKKMKGRKYKNHFQNGEATWLPDHWRVAYFRSKTMKREIQ